MVFMKNLNIVIPVIRSYVMTRVKLVQALDIMIMDCAHIVEAGQKKLSHMIMRKEQNGWIYVIIF